MDMKFSVTQIVAALSTVCVVAAPGAASASFVLDTGTPSGTIINELLNTEYAVEFAANPAETITALAAYVTQGSLQPGATFEFQIFANSAGAPGGTALDSVVATWETPGWTSANTNWTPGAAGDYWLVVEPNGIPQGLDLPTETSASTGTAPALGFAYKGTSARSWTTTSTNTFGAEISAVPLPAAVWLMISGLVGLGALGHRKRGGPRRNALC